MIERLRVPELPLYSDIESEAAISTRMSFLFLYISPCSVPVGCSRAKKGSFGNFNQISTALRWSWFAIRDSAWRKGANRKRGL
jgi:hypothetical protein